MSLKLVTPNPSLIPPYIEAIREGFRDMQLGFGQAAPEEIESDPEAFLDKITDPAPFTVSLNGNEYKVTGHEILWITDDGARFIGSLALRYSGDDEILKRYAGNRGMAIRPSLRHQGYGKRVWRDTFNDVVAKMRAQGLDHMIVTCDPDNGASAHLIELAGGVLEEKAGDVLGTGPSLRYKIVFDRR
jgi:predicted acetyltransferase